MAAPPHVAHRPTRPLHVCCHAAFALPSPKAPLGYAVYTFHPSLREMFLKHPQFIRNVFEGGLVVTEVYDFLDGRRVYVYGKLHFNQGAVFIRNPGYHFEDTFTQYPTLLRHYITPYVPADPCYFMQVFSDNIPL